MAKLKLRAACYADIDGVETKELQPSQAVHDILVKDANTQIEKNRIRYATAYKHAGSYLSN